MKKLTLTITVTLVILGCCLVFFLTKKGNGRTSVSVKDAETSYTFTASFNPGLMPKVTRYADSCANVLRKEKTSFHIKTSTGELAVAADKQLNSSGEMEHIKKMCNGIKDIVIQH